MISSGDRSEIAFFDVETTIPTRPGQGFAILEFGAILVCSRKLVELESYSTLVRPADLSLISNLSVRCNGITKDGVVSAPTFGEIADRVYDILHGRIWAGHNILRFDCTRIREAFAGINRPPPEPRGMIDSLTLLTQRFGRRAGDMKMASLATYFGLGQQTHRSLDDVRMNLEVLKYCATVLLLESSLPDVFTANSWVSPNATTRSRNTGKASLEGHSPDQHTPTSNLNTENLAQSSAIDMAPEIHSLLSLMTPNIGEEVSDTVESSSPNIGEELTDSADSDTRQPDPFDIGPLSNAIEREFLESDVTMDEEVSESLQSDASSGSTEFLEPEEISIPSISVAFVNFPRGFQNHMFQNHGYQKIQILHKDATLQVHCRSLKLRFGISTKFVDHAGRPRLSIVVNASPNICQVLDACDNLARRLSVDSSSTSEWRPVVSRKPGYMNSPTIRLNLPTVVDGDISRWVTEIYQKGASASQRLVFSRFDPAELESILVPGAYLDACFSLETYDYQLNAGIRLVARKLIVHSD